MCKSLCWLMESPSESYPGVGQLGHKIVLLVAWGTVILISIVTRPVESLPSANRDSPSSLPAFVASSFLLRVILLKQAEETTYRMG